jgi:hypothetical protein
MANKKSFWGMLAAALVFGMILLACSDEPGESETWSDVTSVDQLNGTWKGSYSQTMSIKELMGDEWDASMQNFLGNISVAKT